MLSTRTGCTGAEISRNRGSDALPVAGLRERHEQPDSAEHDEHDAQDHAQIAEVRQGVPMDVLIYTLHRSKYLSERAFRPQS